MITRLNGAKIHIFLFVNTFKPVKIKKSDLFIGSDKENVSYSQ